MRRTLTLVVMFLLVFAATASAQEVVRVKGNRTPLRSEPTSSSTLLTYYQMGTKLLALELVDGWYRVRDPQTKAEGYVRATLVDLLAESEMEPRPGAAPRPSQPARQPAAPVTPKVGFRGIADVGAVWMTAAESFEAVTDTNMRVQYGGGVQIVNVWKGLYAEATVGWSQLDGSRVFVYDGTVYDVGIPTTITFIPIDVGGGWRFRHSRKVHSYIGGGVEFLKYQEESDFADADDNVDEVFTGYYASGGVEVRLAKWLYLRGEGRYITVPDALGAGGASVDFKETNLGGASVAVRLAIGK